MAACEVGNGHAIHAMVLDCVKEENTSQGRKLFFVFKNTYKNDKQVKIQIGMSLVFLFLYVNQYIWTMQYGILYVHIFYKTKFEFKKRCSKRTVGILLCSH